MEISEFLLAWHLNRAWANPFSRTAIRRWSSVGLASAAFSGRFWKKTPRTLHFKVTSNRRLASQSPRASAKGLEMYFFFVDHSSRTILSTLRGFSHQIRCTSAYVRDKSDDLAGRFLTQSEKKKVKYSLPRDKTRDRRPKDERPSALMDPCRRAKNYERR